MNGKNLIEVTDELDDELRTEYDVMLLPSCATQNGAKMHIPDEGLTDSVCRKSADWKQKNTKVYPKGHKEWCCMCATLYQRGEL